MGHPKRIFISHTSELTKFPEGKSFIDAAIAAVIRARQVPCDMSYFTARDQKPAAYCQHQVRACDVYVGIIGLRYGSPVRDRPDVSYTELEFEAATEEPKMLRLIFLLDQNALVPAWLAQDPQFGDRQTQFRKRVQDASLTCVSFRDASQLELLIHQALIDSFPKAGEIPQPESIEWPDGKSPYPGLEWFDDTYAPLYFGRDREIDEVIAKMSDSHGRFLIISGASGSGKSSLVAAGLWQALLKEGRLSGSQQWRWLRITPSGDSRGPFVSLASGLKHTFPKMTRPADELADRLATDPTAFCTHVTPHLTTGQELVLVIDQLEELFTQKYSTEVIQSFLAHLVAISQDPQTRCRVVATIRSEFSGMLEASAPVLERLNAGYNYRVGPVSLRVLAEMIERPAQVTGYTLEEGLVDAILDAAGKEPGKLPLVAYTLKQLFEHRQGRTFTHEAYHAMRGVAGAIGTKADQVLSTLREEIRDAFDRVFAELVHLERDRPPTRQRVLLTTFQEDSAATQLVDHLAGPDCRILVTGGDAKNPTVEVAHEQLFTAWPQLHQWIRNSEDALRLIEHATEEARRWQERGDQPEELWLASRAKEVVTALHRFGKVAPPGLDRFLRPQKVLIQQLDQERLSHKQRTIIGWKLAQFGDPRPGVGLRKDSLPDIAWVEIPGGRIALEDVDYVFEVKPFRLAKYPITNRQFKAFIDDEGFKTDEWWKGINNELPIRAPWVSTWDEANCPREMVSWYEAVAFCRWLSHRTNTRIRLPTEWEWQQGATGGNPSYRFPWLGRPDGNRCNAQGGRLFRTTSVGIFPSGATQHGVMDMAGNVEEWCLNTHEDPEKPESVCLKDSHTKRVLRGGSWESLTPEVSFRDYFILPNQRANTIGFRLAQDIP